TFSGDSERSAATVTNCERSSTLTPAPMQTTSDSPGRRLSLQLAARSQYVFPAPPSQVEVQAGGSEAKPELGTRRQATAKRVATTAAARPRRGRLSWSDVRRRSDLPLPQGRRRPKSPPQTGGNHRP